MFECWIFFPLERKWFYAHAPIHLFLKSAARQPQRLFFHSRSGASTASMKTPAADVKQVIGW